MIRIRNLLLTGFLFLTPFVSSASAANYHFNDAANLPWAASSIEKLYQEGIINGVSKTEFAPNDPLTRAQFAAILATTQKGGYMVKNLPFTDVESGQWYYESVKKMYSMGMIKGVSQTQFAPDRTITREEAASLFARTFDDPHKNVSLPFSDQDEISSWAKDSVQKGTAKGLFGIFGNQFKPQQAITRAETAVILHRLLFGEPAPYDPPPAPKEAPKVYESAKPVQQLASRSTDMIQQRLAKAVQSALGVPYVYGGDSLSGMDCSGLTSYVYKQLGVDLPRDSRSQFDVGTPVSVDSMQKGDLIFFDTGGGDISHVGIYMGENKMAHAASKPHEVTISDITWYLNHYKVVGVKRVL
jgi:cell wall-associated NlpC family hydrolase